MNILYIIKKYEILFVRGLSFLVGFDPSYACVVTGHIIQRLESNPSPCFLITACIRCMWPDGYINR